MFASAVSGWLSATACGGAAPPMAAPAAASTAEPTRPTEVTFRWPQRARAQVVQLTTTTAGVTELSFTLEVTPTEDGGRWLHTDRIDVVRKADEAGRKKAMALVGSTLIDPGLRVDATGEFVGVDGLEAVVEPIVAKLDPDKQAGVRDMTMNAITAGGLALWRHLFAAWKGEVAPVDQILTWSYEDGSTWEQSSEWNAATGELALSGDNILSREATMAFFDSLDPSGKVGATLREKVTVEPVVIRSTVTLAPDTFLPLAASRAIEMTATTTSNDATTTALAVNTEWTFTWE